MVDLANAIKDMAVRLRSEADHLDRLAEKLVAEKDLGYVSEAVATVVWIPQSVRMDVLVSRLVRRVQP